MYQFNGLPIPALPTLREAALQGLRLRLFRSLTNWEPFRSICWEQDVGSSKIKANILSLIGDPFPNSCRTSAEPALNLHRPKRSMSEHMQSGFPSPLPTKVYSENRMTGSVFPSAMEHGGSIPFRLWQWGILANGRDEQSGNLGSTLLYNPTLLTGCLWANWEWWFWE